MKYNNIKFGADPELFLLDKSGELRSAIGLIGGTKEEPRKLDEKGNAVQEDNVAVEFNIEPARTRVEFVHNIGSVLEYLSKFVGEKDLALHIVPAAYFPFKELEDPRAQQFGCDPDYNVWTREINEMPTLPNGHENLRSAGGHLHVSWDDPKIEALEELIKALDVFCGAKSILYDGDRLRRKLYGKAGAFRIKAYGGEYRTMSNFWIKTPELVGWVYDQAYQAIDFLNDGGKINSEHLPLIQDCINNGNEASLEELQKYYPV